MAKSPVHVTVTGAAGQIGYALVHRVAHGGLLGPDQPVVLRLLEIEPALSALEGVVMELDDSAFSLLEEVEVSDETLEAARAAVQSALDVLPWKTHGYPRYIPA